MNNLNKKNVIMLLCSLVELATDLEEQDSA